MIRVYELPQVTAPVRYLFSCGKPVEFLMVDWFGEPGDFDDDGPRIGRPELEKFLCAKAYRKAERRYLVVADTRPDLTFVLEPEAAEISTDSSRG